MGRAYRANLDAGEPLTPPAAPAGSAPSWTRRRGWSGRAGWLSRAQRIIEREG